MNYLSTTQGVLFQDTFSKPILARFDQPDSSSDGGAVLLKACDKRLGLTQVLADCLHDQRDPERTSAG